jgi:hypothetical protein
MNCKNIYVFGSSIGLKRIFTPSGSSTNACITGWRGGGKVGGGGRGGETGGGDEGERGGGRTCRIVGICWVNKFVDVVEKEVNCSLVLKKFHFQYNNIVTMVIKKYKIKI